MKSPLLISCKPADLRDGLFGNVFFHIFQILPYLYEKNIFPAWEIRTTLYGTAPDFVTVPGALDLSYAPPQGPYHKVELEDLRAQYGRILGNDWHQLSRIWSAYFKVPQRVADRAEAAFSQGQALGIHYRGNDMLTNPHHSNMFTQENFLFLLKEFLAQRSDFDFIFAATDEFAFVDKLRTTMGLPVVNLGEVGFHMADEPTTPRHEKADRAVLDCLLLARCQCVIESSSALPSFAKVFNPDLEIYRTAASKLFLSQPYFPVAYIPVLPVKSAQSLSILDSSLNDDWTRAAEGKRWQRTFTSVKREPLRQALLILGYRLGLGEKIVALVKTLRKRLRS